MAQVCQTVMRKFSKRTHVQGEDSLWKKKQGLLKGYL